jgi:DNA primase catalytic core
MPRVPDEIIQSLKVNTSMLSLAKKYGLSPQKKGTKGYMAICPFHQVDGRPESQPSFSISPEKNVYHCFSCNAGGDPIKFVMDMEKKTFPEAVQSLLAMSPEGGRQRKEDPAAKEKSQPEELPEPERNRILAEVMRTGTQMLRNNKTGREYLENRGLDPLELLKHYSIGFWNGNQYPNLADGERQKLEQLGLLNEDRYLFENCVVFPLVKDKSIATIYGRKAHGEGSHYLLPGSRQGLYLPKQGLNPREPVIVTESIIDALSLFAAGVHNVLPCLGVNGFLPDHLAYLKQNSFPIIYVAFNGDEAGNRAAAQLKLTLQNAGMATEILELPAEQDLNDMLRELGPAKLKAWFTEKMKTEEPRPTVWEDEYAVYVLFDDREYRVRLQSQSMDYLKVQIKAYRLNRKDEYYTDKLDLYQSRPREHFMNNTARTLGVDAKRIVKDVNALITFLEEYQLERKKREERGPVYAMPDHECREAQEALKSPDLLELIMEDFGSCGMVGNREQCLLIYLGALSRLIGQPYGTLIVSRSGAGKSFIQDMVATFTPEEFLLRMTRLTSQSLFYQGKTGLKHKLISIEEDEGMQEAMYSIRTLLSAQRLQIHSVKTDSRSGELVPYENIVEGPASVLISTTDLASFNFENVNRFLVVHLDESPEQTRRIMEHQRKIAGLEGIKQRLAAEKIAQRHRNMQRLLKPVTVVNRLNSGVEYPDDLLNARRENTKLDALIKTVALLHQHQREIKQTRFFDTVTTYIEVTQKDIDTVHRIAAEVLRQSIDELSKLCRELLTHIHALVDERFAAEKALNPDLQRWQVRFSRKELKDRCGWSRWHLEEHLRELVEAGYIAERMGKRGQRYSYSLVEDSIPEPPRINL